MDSKASRVHSRWCGSALGLTVLFALFVLCSSAIAQQPSIRPYESEEDLWEALNDGEISFDEFTELLDLARSGADSLLTPRSDWEALPGSEAGYLVTSDSTQPLTQPARPTASRVDIPWVSSVRMGVDADLNEPTGSDGYSVVRFQRGDWRGVFDFEHDSDDGSAWRRRSLVWHPKNYSITLGNFEPRWGRGLVLGRRSRVIRSSEVSGDVWQPTHGRFNGAWIASDIGRGLSAQSMFSAIYTDSIAESFAAIRGEVQVKGNRLGATLASGSFRRFSQLDERSNGYWTDNLNVAGLDFYFRVAGREFLGEIAHQSEGSTAKSLEMLWPLSAGRFHARAWSYGAGFSNPWGGGPGHNDTREIGIPDSDYSFSSRTAGERGFDFTTRIAATPNVNLRWDWMSHREAPGENLEHSGILRAEIKRPTFRTTPFVRAQIDEDETESYSLGNYLWWGPDNRELNLRAEFGSHYDDEVQFVRLGLGARVQINRVVRFAPAIRWNDPNLDEPLDGYWYFYFTETVLPIQGARVELALAWKKYEATAKDDLVELRVRGFVR